MLQPDFGTLMVLMVILVGLLIVAGITGRQMLVLVLLTVTGIFMMVNLGLVKQYQIDRLNFLDRDHTSAQSSGYNQEQSIQAIANGRATGEGIGNGSSTQGSFVPEQHTDFIFTAVGEELGFVGSAGVLGAARPDHVADVAHRAVWPATSSACWCASGSWRCSRSRSSRTSA